MHLFCFPRHGSYYDGGSQKFNQSFVTAYFVVTYHQILFDENFKYAYTSMSFSELGIVI